METKEESQEELSATVESLALGRDTKQLETVFNTLSSTETARMLADLPRDSRSTILSILPPEDAARIVESISEAQAAELLAELLPTTAAAVLTACESNEQIDILGQLPELQVDLILDEMDSATAADMRTRIEYDPRTAGGLMVTEFLKHPVEGSIADVIEYLRANESAVSDYTVQYVFVVGGQGELIGVLRLRDLVMRPSQTAVAAIMIKDPISVPVATTLEELEDIFDRYRFIGIPVVDEQQRIVGIVRRADVHEAVGERSDSDYLKSSGILGGEELRSMPVALRSRRRLSWLTINIFLNLFAAAVISYYQDTLQAVIALAVFLPIISDMSGCSGSQAVAVSVRELTLGLIRGKDILKTLLKEVSVGLINGLVLGSLIACVAWIWKGSPVLGLVVGVALAANTLLAVAIGGVIPLLLTHFKKDPALASGPILTTVTDMCGFFLVLSLAQICLPWLT